MLDVGQTMILIKDVQQSPCIGAGFTSSVNLQFDPKVSGPLAVENGFRFIGVIMDCLLVFSVFITAMAIGIIFLVI